MSEPDAAEKKSNRIAGWVFALILACPFALGVLTEMFPPSASSCEDSVPARGVESPCDKSAPGRKTNARLVVLAGAPMCVCSGHTIEASR